MLAHRSLACLGNSAACVHVRASICPALVFFRAGAGGRPSHASGKGAGIGLLRAYGGALAGHAHKHTHTLSFTAITIKVIKATIGGSKGELLGVSSTE